ncbi:MAG: hypothetical protein OXG42_08040 [Chloroflexi bacterium]|nr:hypothetical protein [Chloroflexota bacterium]
MVDERIALEVTARDNASDEFERIGRSGKGQSTAVTVARREIRKWLSESAEGQRVEELVGRLLGC